ncbi:SDR family oxidoreductase [Mesorhizobium sp.]|uniref:SDR family oxidoreductase n=1 Tax=Mesorhizobium sp. TaxID=1871066 RepID=UPI002582B25B|nr:SDR family oxidoreductase [Mesorhizobium sp.]
MIAVLITGANRGIGFALAQQYAADGTHVIACCRDPARADALRELEASSNGRVRIVQLDVADEVSISALAHALGDQPIDILINNAGVVGPEPQSATHIDAEGWLTTMRINALAPILIAQALRNNLLRGSEKKVVAISSTSGSTERYTNDGDNAYAYKASKAALNNGMRSLARDWAGDGLLVGIVDPGYVRTDMGGAGAAASPKSVSAEESARGIIGCIAKLAPDTSGIFQRYWGEVIPW